MKRIEDIKKFEDIDTYYEISNIVEEVFEDRVEAHKHLVIANKEIERLNNIINEAVEYMETYIKLEDAPINERIKIEFEEVLNILRGEIK